MAAAASRHGRRQGGARRDAGHRRQRRDARDGDARAMDVFLDVRRFGRTPLLTPHAGGMAHLTGLTKEAVSAEPERHARETAVRWNAVVALKGATTYIASPDGDCWRHAGGDA